MSNVCRNVVVAPLFNPVLTAAVVFLLAVASVFQYLMGVTGVPTLLAEVLGPGLEGFLIQAITAPLAILFDALSFLASIVSLIVILDRRSRGVFPGARRLSGWTRIIPFNPTSMTRPSSSDSMSNGKRSPSLKSKLKN